MNDETEATMSASRVSADAAGAVEPVDTEAGQVQNPNMRWYVVQAFSGFEKQVRKALYDHIARMGMEAYFGSILVPTEEVV